MLNRLIHKTDRFSIPDFLFWLFHRDEWREIERAEIAHTIAYAREQGVPEDTINQILLAHRSPTTDVFLAKKK